jgi:hypothetical protein
MTRKKEPNQPPDPTRIGQGRSDYACPCVSQLYRWAHKMAMSLLRILLGISAGVLVIAALFGIGLKYPAICAILLSLGIAGLFGSILVRSLKTGTIVARDFRYHRKKSPFAYWFWFCFLAVSGPFFIFVCVYSLVFH